MIALIPARGGSKGLPKKNTLLLNGKPLIAHTIEAALNASCIDRVVVSTDDNSIAEIAIEYGAEVPFIRPSSLATDESSAVDVYNHALDFLEEELEERIPTVMILLPTCPLRTSNDIDAAEKLFLDRNADSVISYTKEYHPISWHRYLDKSGKFESILPPNLDNRQELRPSYFPNGAIYIFKTELLRNGMYYSSESYAYEMPRERSADIDTLDDMNYVEYIMNRKDNE